MKDKERRLYVEESGVLVCLVKPARSGACPSQRVAIALRACSGDLTDRVGHPCPDIPVLGRQQAVLADLVVQRTFGYAQFLPGASQVMVMSFQGFNDQGALDRFNCVDQ